MSVGPRFSVQESEPWQLTLHSSPDDFETIAVAIDDLSIENGLCKDIISCDFEYDLCLWQNTLDLQWSRGT